MVQRCPLCSSRAAVAKGNRNTAPGSVLTLGCLWCGIYQIETNPFGSDIDDLSRLEFVSRKDKIRLKKEARKSGRISARLVCEVLGKS